jgi:hypothetical protein
MATLDELKQALRAADAAGNDADAQRLAAAITNYSPENNTPPPAPNGVDVYSQMPMWQKIVAHPSDSLRLANNAMTLGAWDNIWGRIAPAIGGGDVEQQRLWTKQARDRGGSGGAGLEMAASAIPTIATDGATAAPSLGTGLTGMLKRLGVAGAEGAGYGGIQANNEGRDGIEGMETGAGFGVAGHALGGILGRTANRIDDALFPPAKPMSLDNLRAAKDQAYAETAAHGVQYTPNTIRGMLADMDAAAQPYPGRHDQAIAARAQVGKNIGGGRPVSLPEVDRNRQIISNDLNTLGDKAQAGIGLDYIGAMDKYLDNVDSAGVTARSGDPVAGLEAQNRARELNSRTRKLADLEALNYKSSLQAAKNMNSGVDSTLKNNVTSVLTNEKKRAGYTPDEIAQMEEIVNGTTGQNIARQVGRAAPGGGYSGIGGGVAAGIGGLLSGFNPTVMAAAGAIPSVVGYGAKKISERSTARSGQKLLDLVASGGKKVQKTPLVGPLAKDRIGRQLMMLMMNQNQ